MKKHDRFSPPAIGASSLLTAFALLVLCVFALLCVSSAQAESRLSVAAAENTRAYYEADLQAEAIFARLRSGDLPDSVQTDGALYRYTCPISATQTLCVTLSHADSHWQVLQWQVIAEDTPAETSTIQLWTGGTL